MKDYFELISSSLDIAKMHRNGEYKRVTFPVLNGLSYCIYQKYKTLPSDSCFWELHQDFIDINVWLDGEERIHSSVKLDDFSNMEYAAQDFWKSFKEFPINQSIVLNSSVPIVLFDTNIPHKCQISENKSFIEKLTLKIHRNEFTGLL